MNVIQMSYITGEKNVLLHYRFFLETPMVTILMTFDLNNFHKRFIEYFFS